MPPDAVPAVGGDGGDMGPTKEQLERMERARTLHRLGSATTRVAGPRDRDALESTSKADIHSVKVLGEGAFGLVDLVLVERQQAGCLLCVRKKLLKQSDSNNNDPELEVQFLEDCSGCNFVVQMWSHVVGLYDYTLLLEYCPYGSLDKLLMIVSELRSRSSSACWDWLSDRVLKSDRRAGFSEDEARFYIACSVLGLESMHQRGILHRDIKPSNMLVAENRYVKLGDLGLCKKLGEEGRAYTHVGTPGYMAPEVVHGQGNGGGNAEGKKSAGYSYPADVWSLGMMLWELVDGALPKWAAMSWYWTSLHFPQHFSPELRSLLQGCLQKGAKERIKLSEIKKHAWYRGFDWEALESQSMEAPNPTELLEVHIHTSIIHHMQDPHGGHL